MPFQKKNLLFIAENVTLAHIVRLLVLANSLANKKYKIIFASGHEALDLIEEYGFEFIPIQTLTSSKFIDRLAKGNRIYSYDELKESVESDLELIQKVSPDLIIGDFRISLGISTEITKTPYVSLVNAHWSPYSVNKFPFPEHPISKIMGLKFSQFVFSIIQPLIFHYHTLPFNAVRKCYNLKPLTSLREIYSYGKWVLYPDIPELAPTSQLPDSHQYIGSVIWSPSTPLPEWWEKVTESDRPIIYLTLGSSGNIKIINILLTVLEKMPVIVVVASANRYISSRTTNNIYYANFLPGEKIAKKASLVICNGGSATAYQALVHGKPVLGFPSNTDQHFTMNSIVQAGAGISIRSERANLKNINFAVNSLLYSNNYKLNAKRLNKVFDHYNSAVNFQNLLDKIGF